MPTLTICITVDWEGQNLSNANLSAMENFRLAFPNLPLTHFICPAYFTRGDAAGPIAAQILRPIQPIDEIGLHVHGWKTLVEGAGVVFIRVPTWYAGNADGPVVPYGAGQQDYGHGVPLGLYSRNDLVTIFNYANGLLTANNVAPATPVSFRCGGWMAADRVQEAIATTPTMRIDSSATDGPYFQQINALLQGFNCTLGAMIPVLYGPAAVAAPPQYANTHMFAQIGTWITAGTQPFVVPTPQGPVFQATDNGVLADYLSGQMIYQRFIDAWNDAAHRDTVLVVGFHQESATTRNLYDVTPNLQNFSAALAQFLAFIGMLPQDGKALGKPEVLFKTIKNLKLKGGGVRVTPCKEALAKIEALPKASANMHEGGQRFFG